MMRGIEQKTTLEQKLEKLRVICEKAPDNPIGLLALAETAFRRGLRLEALEAYQKVLKDESVAEAHLCMAQMYRHHGLFQEAISELRTLFEIEPGYPEAHVFARELARETTLPSDIEDVLVAGCGNDELSLARVRLSIARSLVLREGQELVAIQDANSGDPTFGYYIGETRKRLTYCEEVLSSLSALDEARRAYLADQDRQRQIERERQRERDLVELGQGSTVSVEVEAVGSIEGPDLELLGAAEVEVGAATEWVDQQEDLVEDPAVAEVSPVYGEADPAEESPYEPAEPVSEAADQPLYIQDADSYQEEPEVTPIPDRELQAATVETPRYDARLDEPVAAVEPALWDDPPRVVAPGLPLAGTAESNSDRYAHEELTLDLTPTLVGDLPEPAFDPEPVQIHEAEPLAPGDLWEDPPLDHGPIGLQAELGPAQDENYGYQSPLGDDLRDSAESEPKLELEPKPSVTLEPELSPGTGSSNERDFAQLYEPLMASLDGLIQTLAKTRSVSSVFLLNREGYPIAQQVKDPITQDRLSEFIVETVSFLEAFSDSPQYWVLECAGGIVVIQSVDSYHFLVTIGQTGANFGALRYTMDRVRPNFEQVLQAATPG
jgi:predicted regulator of Ras-like GTPase activity (Roadblock/LC7/MglB family)/tetratricopeptide (TPR) repeat protein